MSCYLQQTVKKTDLYYIYCTCVRSSPRLRQLIKYSGEILENSICYQMRAHHFFINSRIVLDKKSVELCYRSDLAENSQAPVSNMANFVRYFLIFTTFLVLIFGVICNATDESPGFFLKVTKNVPRLGRRSQSINEFENFFLKASKTVPRIGRRDDKVCCISQKLTTVPSNLRKFHFGVFRAIRVTTINCLIGSIKYQINRND